MSAASTNYVLKTRAPLPPPPPTVTIRCKYDEDTTIQKLEEFESRVKDLEDSLITNTFSRITGVRTYPSDISEVQRRAILGYIRTKDEANIQAFVDIYGSGCIEYFDIRFSAIENEYAINWNSQYDTVEPYYDDDEDECEEVLTERRTQAEAEAEASSERRTVERIGNNLFMIEKLGTCFLSPEWIGALMYKGKTKPYEWALVKEHYEQNPENFHYDDGKPMCDEDGEFILDEFGNPIYQNVLNLNGLFNGEGLERE